MGSCSEVKELEEDRNKKLLFVVKYKKLQLEVHNVPCAVMRIDIHTLQILCQ